MKKNSVFLCVTLALLAGMYSCTKDKTTTGVTVDCTGINDSTNTYTKNIGPNITDYYCNYAPCHDAGTASNGINMNGYSNVVAAFKNNNVIGALKGQIELMPKNGPALPDSLIKQLQCWQQNGYPQ